MREPPYEAALVLLAAWLYAPDRRFSMGKVTAKLRSPSLAGDTIHTQWGHVSFDSEGISSLEVDEADLPLLRGLKWLSEAPQSPPEALPVKAKAPPEAPAPAFDLTDEGEAAARKRKR